MPAMPRSAQGLKCAKKVMKDKGENLAYLQKNQATTKGTEPKLQKQISKMIKGHP